MSSTGRKLSLWLLALLCMLHQPASARVSLSQYGLSSIPDSVRSTWVAKDSLNSMIMQTPVFAIKQTVSAIEKVHVMHDKTNDFYLLLLAVISLGLIRVMDPKYFNNLWRAFRNPTLSSRIFKELLDSSPLSDLLMNIFFTIVAGSYIYYLVRLTVPYATGHIEPWLLVVGLISGVGFVYLAKHFIIRFSGWAFKVQGVTEDYLFNVFLINKVLSVVLLPFVIVLAFADEYLTAPAVIVSLIVIVLMFANRYVRSWKVYGSFFQYSRFHFFTYLCASELLPLAVLMKLLVRGLLY